MTDLDNLIDAVEAGAEVGSCPSANMCDAAIPGCLSHAVLGAFNGSLDAAKALNDALLPGWGWETGVNATFVSIAQVWKSGRDAAISATAENPARAWLIAILKAYRTTQEASE